MSDWINAAQAGRILGVSRQRAYELASVTLRFLTEVTTPTGYRVWPRHFVEEHLGVLDRKQRGQRPNLPVLEGLPPAAQHVLELARLEARQLNHHWVSVDHLLIAMLSPRCPGSARDVLESLGLSEHELRQSYVRSMGDPFAPLASDTQPPSEPSLDLHRASYEAYDLQDEVVASEHVLIAAARAAEADHLGPLVFRGIAADTIRDRVLAVTEGTVPISALRAPEPAERTRPYGYPHWAEPEPELGVSPLGHHPLRRRPWTAVGFHDVEGHGGPLMEGKVLLQYFLDRDGYPLLSSDGQPVHVVVDDAGNYVYDEENVPLYTVVEVPPGSRPLAYPTRADPHDAP